MERQPTASVIVALFPGTVVSVRNLSARQSSGDSYKGWRRRPGFLFQLVSYIKPLYCVRKIGRDVNASISRQRSKQDPLAAGSISVKRR